MLWPETDPHRWRAPVDDFPPRWASAFGDDQYGLWAEVVVGGVTQRMRWIEPTGPDGYIMGSTKAERQRLTKNARRAADAYEHEPTRVEIKHGFWLADTACTQALWMAVMDGDNPSTYRDGDEAPLRPVDRVTWNMAQGFLARLSSMLEGGGQAQLPEEACWEYACRGGTVTAYHWGDEPDPALAHTSESGMRWTTPVKRFPPNAWGIYDMNGNVREWCVDAWREPGSAEPDLERGSRVLRGGSWDYDAGWARSAHRAPGTLVDRQGPVGFRFTLRSSTQEL